MHTHREGASRAACPRVKRPVKPASQPCESSAGVLGRRTAWQGGLGQGAASSPGGGRPTQMQRCFPAQVPSPVWWPPAWIGDAHRGGVGGWGGGGGWWWGWGVWGWGNGSTQEAACDLPGGSEHAAAVKTEMPQVQAGSWQHRAAAESTESTHAREAARAMRQAPTCAGVSSCVLPRSSSRSRATRQPACSAAALPPAASCCALSGAAPSRAASCSGGW